LLFHIASYFLVKSCKINVFIIIDKHPLTLIFSLRWTDVYTCTQKEKAVFLVSL